MTFDEKLKKRAKDLEKILNKDYPQIIKKQAKPLENGLPESGYWYSGYYVAICDVINLLESQFNEDTPESDNDNLFH